ncbi:MAG: response regulator [Polyangiaceae bacterium]
MPASERIRVLIADDHSIVLEGLSALISRQGDMVVVAEANDGDDAVSQWRALRPDVTLLDLRMPRLEGIDAMTHIRAVDRGARVIVLTTFDTDEDIFRAIKAGARAYLLKDAGRDELLTCIRRVHAGETLIGPGIAAKLVGRIGANALTPREGDALALLVRGRNNKQIASALRVREATVKSHLRSIFSKLQVASRAEAIAEALHRGLAHL